MLEMEILKKEHEQYQPNAPSEQTPAANICTMYINAQLKHAYYFFLYKWSSDETQKKPSKDIVKQAVLQKILENDRKKRNAIESIRHNNYAAPLTREMLELLSKHLPSQEEI